MTFSKLPLVVAVSSLALVTACDTTGPNGNQQARTGAAIGAGLGALTGFLAGDNARESRQGALTGAILGAGGGALIGTSCLPPTAQRFPARFRPICARLPARSTSSRTQPST